MYQSNPQAAFQTFLSARISREGWFQDSRELAPELPVSARELLGMILLAYRNNHLDRSRSWTVGYDPDASEPNDGFVSNDQQRIDLEHKLIAYQDERDIIEGIIGTYDRYAANGLAYGQHRTLIIHANKQSPHLERISDLHQHIREGCPFDRVLLISLIAEIENDDICHFQISEHFPELHNRQVDLSLRTGEGINPYCAEQ
ncbi:MAG: hypothetical protein ABW116_01565 [Candidatus Sedimenticola sp. 20ELBAFRAG]